MTPDTTARTADAPRVSHLLMQGEARRAVRSRELPAAPRNVQDTGLPPLLLGELLLKTMQRHGLQQQQALSQHLRLAPTLIEELCQPLRKDGLIDVRLRGARDGDVTYELTTAGRARAAEALARCLYSGPAPVTLEAYAARVREQSETGATITRARFAEAMAGITLSEALREQLGAAMNSGSPTLLYGPPGAGKTFLGRQMARLLSGEVAVPHAIEVGGEIIRLHDPLVHRPARRADGGPASLDGRRRADERWVLCERPVVVVGSELTLEALELRFDPLAGTYQASPQIQANNGLLLVDDLGRQRIEPHELLNRWLQPIEQRVDRFVLRSGTSFVLPFDNHLFFSTNLAPETLADAAFLRRLGYKIRVDALGAADYREVARAAFEGQGVRCDEPALDHLLDHYHGHLGHPRLACHPGELARRVADRARYLDEPAALTHESLAWAWSHNFAHAEPGPGTAAANSLETTP